MKHPGPSLWRSSINPPGFSVMQITPDNALSFLEFKVPGGEIKKKKNPEYSKLLEQKYFMQKNHFF